MSTTMERAAALLPNADSGALAECIEQAMGQFRLECGRDDVPEDAQPVIVRMALHIYGRIGAEGLASQNYSGASEAFLSDWPDELRRAIHRYRRVSFA